MTFSNQELPPEGSGHNKPLYISLECWKKRVPVIPVDTGSAINFCPLRTTYAIRLKPMDFTPTTQLIQAYENTSQEVIRTINVQIIVGLSEHEAEFHVVDIPATFNLLLRRLWLHQMKAISSTIHQLVKYPHKRGIATLFKNSSIHPPPEVTMLLLEIQHGEDDAFLSCITLAEAQVVQMIMVEDEGLYVSAQSIYFISKLGHITGMG